MSSMSFKGISLVSRDFPGDLEGSMGFWGVTKVFQGFLMSFRGFQEVSEGFKEF